MSSFSCLYIFTHEHPHILLLNETFNKMKQENIFNFATKRQEILHKRPQSVAAPEAGPTVVGCLAAWLLPVTGSVVTATIVAHMYTGDLTKHTNKYEAHNTFT